MENHERMERELLEQCGQVATLVECFAWLQLRQSRDCNYDNRGGEDRATRECKNTIRAIFRAR